MIKLSVVIVAYRSEATIEACVSSLPADAEIIVVENQAEGSVLPNLRGVVLVRMPANEGFGIACNSGLDLAGGEFALVLNPDAWANAINDVHRLTQFLDDAPTAICVGGRLRLPDGSVQLSCARELTLGAVFLEQTLLEKVVKGYWIETASATEPLKVPQVTGACFAMKRVNGQFLRFDPRFFLYCEDSELMNRIANYGDIYHLPSAEFHHALGASSEQNRWWAVACYNRGKELYFEIHHGGFQSKVCFALNRLGALLRLLIWSVATIVTLGLVGRFRKQVATFARVLFAPFNPYARAPWSRSKP
ncbi:MAG: glycosyltransferase family 2 protein [Armatimonadota bacterium]|nr:glycosyltransferase family 2 protein [Armatimonadota bacterium]